MRCVKLGIIIDRGRRIGGIDCLLVRYGMGKLRKGESNL